jgi:signal peptidase II
MRKWLMLAAVVVVLDQITKYIIIDKLALHQMIEVTPFFNIVHVRNTGAAFSMLAGAGGWQRYFFIAVAVVASVWVIWLLRQHPREKLFCLALGLILGGAIGNLIDRVMYGNVVDFIQVHYAGWYFPAFNVADAAITVGAGLMIWDGFFTRREPPGETAKSS